MTSFSIGWFLGSMLIFQGVTECLQLKEQNSHFSKSLRRHFNRVGWIGRLIAWIHTPHVLLGSRLKRPFRGRSKGTNTKLGNLQSCYCLRELSIHQPSICTTLHGVSLKSCNLFLSLSLSPVPLQYRGSTSLRYQLLHTWKAGCPNLSPIVVPSTHVTECQSYICIINNKGVQMIDIWKTTM